MMTTELRMDGRLRARCHASGIEEAYLPSPCVQNHAANLMSLPGGDLGCVWFGGTQEGKSDISIYFSRLRAGEKAWSNPLRLSEDADRSEQNPILFPAPDGSLWLLHTAQFAGNQNTSVVKRRVSRDGGKTWSPADVLDRRPRHFRSPAAGRDSQRRLVAAVLCVPHGARDEVVGRARRQRRQDLVRSGPDMARSCGAGQSRIGAHERRGDVIWGFDSALSKPMGRPYLRKQFDR